MYADAPNFNWTLLGLAALTLYWVYRKFRVRRISLLSVPGPPAPSWLYGNLIDIFRGQAGEKDFELFSQYGDAVLLTAPLGHHELLIRDPKAIQYITQTASYNFVKNTERRTMASILTGPGIGGAEGENHKRIRRIMLPAFGAAESRALLPLFQSAASKMCLKWFDLVSDSNEGEVAMDVANWMSRATLDAIGTAAFDYEFEALGKDDNELANSFRNLFFDLLGSPSKNSFLFVTLLRYIPSAFVDFVFTHSGTKGIARAMQHRALAEGVARDLVKQKSEAIFGEGKGGRDVMSLLVRANGSRKPGTGLNEAEMLAQLQTIMFAGHETTATSLSWTLFRLSQYPDIQSKLRQEIRTHAARREGREFTPKDYEEMVYLNALIKESLRFDPVAIRTYRQPLGDEVLPLATAIVLPSGTTITELPIPKGTKILLSITGYNRLPEVFGADAHEFNPERWLRDSGVEAHNSVGVYSNLLSFLGGPRGCIGWRFALLEMQAFLVEMIGKFEFSLAEPAQNIRREICGIVVPTVEGKRSEGVQLPMKIRFVDN